MILPDLILVWKSLASTQLSVLPESGVKGYIPVRPNPRAF